MLDDLTDAKFGGAAFHAAWVMTGRGSLSNPGQSQFRHCERSEAIHSTCLSRLVLWIAASGLQPSSQ
jgi:hypothetical protein